MCGEESPDREVRVAGGIRFLNADSLVPFEVMRIPKKSKMRGLIRLPIDNADVLIYSNLDSDRGHSRSEGRERITVWASFDGAKSWPVKRLVYDGPSAYSTLAAGRKGTITEGMIYLTFEGGPRGQHADVLFARFNLAWLMDGGADWRWNSTRGCEENGNRPAASRIQFSPSCK